jgi:hypothetical protein
MAPTIPKEYFGLQDNFSCVTKNVFEHCAAMSETGKRIKKALDGRHVTWLVARLGERGVEATADMLYQHIRGRAEHFNDPHIIPAVCEILGVSRLWLERGIEERSRFVPIRWSLGAGQEIVSWGEEYGFLELPPLPANEYEAAQVSGDSMVPFVRHRDYVVIATDREYTPEECISRHGPALVETDDGSTWIKEIRPGSKRGLYDLLSYADHFEPMTDRVIKRCAPVVGTWAP